MRFLVRLGGIVGFATCTTMMILMGYFAFQGTLNMATGTKIIALLNGIDISGNRLEQVLRENDDREQPDFDEILQSRSRESLDIEMRDRSQREFHDELVTMLADLKDQRERFDARREAFDKRLKEVREGAQEEGLKEVQMTLQAIEADQAKEQLLRMFDEKKDDVVKIIQAMPMDRRSEILAEFTTPEEADKLYEILRLIGEGMPTTGLIDGALQAP